LFDRPKPTAGCSANGRRSRRRRRRRIGRRRRGRRGRGRRRGRRSIVLPKISVRYVAVFISDRKLIKEDYIAAMTAVDVLKDLV
jgi:trimethylamine:corrinoid methyltransferase-like protein